MRHLESAIKLHDESTRQELQETGKLHRQIAIDKLQTAKRKLIEGVAHPAGEFLEFTILHYNSETGALIPDRHTIPIWLRDSILAFKGNDDCYPLSKDFEVKYTLSHRRYDSSKSPDYLRFDVVPRTKPFYDGFIVDCETTFLYSVQELGSPSTIFGFCRQFLSLRLFRTSESNEV